jgi:thiol:disulfide interchange protein DsbD
MQLLRHIVFVFYLLPMVAVAASSSGVTGTGLGAFLSGAKESDILQADQAFKLSVSAKDAQTLIADFQIVPGHYLYRQRIKFEINSPGGRIGSTELPHGELKQDKNFGEIEIFHQNFSAQIKLVFTGIAPRVVNVLATYQGCSEKGLCYAPIHKTLEIELLSSATATAPAATATDDDQAKSLLEGGKLWLIILSFFGFGLLLSLTPCVLPMIPILSGIIVGSKNNDNSQAGTEKISRLHSFNLSLAYTMGMALSYTLAGIVAGLSGYSISAALQNSWALGIGALIFVLLALSMFGFYELQLPSALESRIVNTSNRFKGGRFASVFVMGALSALIVSPCIAAPLAGALAYISKTHDAVVGGVALFSLAMGMGVPLLLIGASAGTLLPKPGAWMNAVRNFFGVAMLAMAVWISAPVLPEGLVMGLWAALLIVPAIYMHALDSLPPRHSAWAKFWKGIAIIMLITGGSILLGGLSGNHSPLQPLAGFRSSAKTDNPSTALQFQRIKSNLELDNALKQAHGKFVMLDFYADWCTSCKEYEQYTFRDGRVQKLLKNVVLLQVDATQNSNEDWALMSRFGLFGLPGIVFFDQKGNEMAPLKVVGYQSAEKFLVSLNGVYAAREGECAPVSAC